MLLVSLLPISFPDLLSFCDSTSVVGLCMARSAYQHYPAPVTICISFSLFFLLIPFHAVKYIWCVSVMVCLWLRFLPWHWYWLFFIIDDFLIVDEVNCLFLCFLYLYYLILFVFFYPFVTPLWWWVCVRQGVLTNVTQLWSHYVLSFTLFL